MTMEKKMVIQGRVLTSEDIQLIRRFINDNPSLNRTQLSKHLCRLWNWQASNGQLKDMACRSLFLKLERDGHITLPPARKSANNSLRNRSFQYVRHQKTPIQTRLKSLFPIQIEPVQNVEKAALFKTLVSLYHYLGYSGTVGENIKYLAFDQKANPIGCVLFGSAAWKIAPRDALIGWGCKTRQHNLHLLTNNMRFLILPWIRVPHLASYLLSRIAKRISADWQSKYNHPIYLLETFVERQRFQGTCYKAANWIFVGQTKGRTRNDRNSIISVPSKDIYLYPLTKNFREVLLYDA
jgi:hypothetical protein